MGRSEKDHKRRAITINVANNVMHIAERILAEQHDHELWHCVHSVSTDPRNEFYRLSIANVGIRTEFAWDIQMLLDLGPDGPSIVGRKVQAMVQQLRDELSSAQDAEELQSER